MPALMTRRRNPARLRLTGKTRHLQLVICFAKGAGCLAVSDLPVTVLRVAQPQIRREAREVFGQLELEPELKCQLEVGEIARPRHQSAEWLVRRFVGR